MREIQELGEHVRLPTRLGFVITKLDSTDPTSCFRTARSLSGHLPAAQGCPRRRKLAHECHGAARSTCDSPRFDGAGEV